MALPRGALGEVLSSLASDISELCRVTKLGAIPIWSTRGRGGLEADADGVCNLDARPAPAF